MSFNCCDIPNLLSSFPKTWRDELTSVLCKMYAPIEDSFICDAVKSCETLTSISTFQLTEDNKIVLSYIDEIGTTNDFEIDLSEIVITNPITDARNGLELILNKVELGGDLVKNTTVVLDGYDFTLDGEDIIFSSFPSSRNDSNPENFLFTDSQGKLKSANLEDSVQSIVNTYLTNIFNTALGSQTGCLPENWEELSLQDKMTALMDVIKQLCQCCETTANTLSLIHI